MTDKQELFIQEYLTDLNATRAAKRAGYSEKTAYSIGQENLTKPEIQQVIQEHLEKRKSALIATREQRQQLWTEIMYDTEQSTKDRLRASELLAKSQGDFIERIEAKSETIDITMRANIRSVLLEDLGSKEDKATPSPPTYVCVKHDGVCKSWDPSRGNLREFLIEGYHSLRTRVRERGR